MTGSDTSSNYTDVCLLNTLCAPDTVLITSCSQGILSATSSGRKRYYHFTDEKTGAHSE